MKTNVRKFWAAGCLLLATVCFLSLFFVRSVSAQTETADIYMADGAAVRYKEQEETDRSGIRFDAFVSSEYKSENPDAAYGMLLIPASELGEGALTKETAGAIDKETEVWRAESETEGYDKFSTVLYNIPENAYGTVIAARAYIENGEDVVYAEQTIERSIAQVASEAVAEGDDHEELLAYIDGALKTENGGSFTVAESSLDLYVGDSKKLTVTIAPAELTAIYASDNGEVVSVSQDGTLTALAEGSANVTVTLGSAVKTVEVSVTELGIAGAPVREVACNADGTAAEFDLTGILCDNGEYVAGTVTNSDGGEVNYKEGEENILLVKAGERYTFTNTYGSVQIRGTAKNAYFYLDFSDESETDLVEITSGNEDGKVTFDGGLKAIRSAWDAASYTFGMKFTSDGLISSETSRTLLLDVATEKASPDDFNATVTIEDASGKAEYAPISLYVGAWGDTKPLAVVLPAGVELSDLTFTFQKDKSTNLLVKNFRLLVNGTENEINVADFTYAEDSYTGSGFFGISSDGKLRHDWNNPVASFNYCPPILVLPESQAYTNITLKFDYTNFEFWDYLTTGTFGEQTIEMNGASETVEFTLVSDGGAIPVTGEKVSFSMPGAWGQFDIDNVRYVLS